MIVLISYFILSLNVRKTNRFNRTKEKTDMVRPMVLCRIYIFVQFRMTEFED
jgi:hypothetical protein